MRLTQTQQALIELARRHGGRYSVTASSGRGAKGGRHAYGARQRAAMFALESLGLIRITDRQTDQDYANGYCITSTSWAFALVECA